MARRRRLLLSDEDPDSDASGSSSASADLEGEGSRKRKRGGNRKEDAIYGIFAEPDEDGYEGRKGSSNGKSREGRRVDYTRGPTFVSAGKATASDSNAQQGHASDESDSDSADSQDEFSEAEELARLPVTEEEELETRPAFGVGSRGPTGEAAAARQAVKEGFQPASFVSSRGGIGSSSQRNSSSVDAEMETDSGTAGIGASRGGIGSGRGGIGSSSASTLSDPQASSSSHPTFTSANLSNAGVPSSFGASPSPAVAPSDAFKKKRSFLPGASSNSNVSSSSGVPKTSIKFGSGSGGGFNPAAMMAKMGWTGGGLGKEGEGIVNPVEVQLRPEKAGIAFGGRKEKTKQAKEEARRRGEAVSSDEEDKKNRRKGKGKGKEQSSQEKRKKKEIKENEPQAWTRAEKKPRKPKVEHRTYEQIIEAAGGIPDVDSGVGQIIDATGAELKEVTSLASALSSHAVPTSDSTRLPELRHNLRLICDQNKQSLDLLAKDGANIFDRKRWLKREAEEAKRRLEAEEVEKKRLEEILNIVNEIETLGKKARIDDAVQLETFSPLVDRLVKQFDREIKSHALDEAVVGSIVPIVRRIMTSWSPLEDPSSMTSTLKRWRSALRISDAASDSFVDQYGVTRRKNSLSEKGRAVMTPYESLLWNVWMPKIRSSINNQWKPTDPKPAVSLLEAWKPLLPRFILDNITDQLLLPKIRSAVSEWEPKRSKVGLHHIVFPWLPLFEERMESIVQECRRRLKSVLKVWRPLDGVPSGLERWKEIIPSTEWDSLILSTLVPKLSAALRTDLRINPSAQDMAPLEKVIAWRTSLRPSVLSRLIETEMFPKWLEVLHMWLIQKGANFDEIAQWYSFWKSWFPAEITSLPGVAQGFQRGLNLINEAITLPSDQRSRLAKPETTPLSRTVSEAVDNVRNPAAALNGSKKGVKAAELETETGTSFRSIVEEAATSSDLLILPSGTHPKNGIQVLKVSRNVDGKGGKRFYLDEDVVWMEKKDGDGGEVEWNPVGVQELISSVK